MRGLLVVLVVFLVNLPAVHEGWTDHRVATKGHDVAATVIDARDLDGKYLVDYRLPKSEDPTGTKFSASVDLPTYGYAEANDKIIVRMIKGEPGSNRPLGLVPSSLFKVAAISADIVLVLIGALVWYRRRHPGDMPDS